MSAPNLRIALGPQYNTNRIRAALEACKDYFAERADAEIDASGCYTGNEEMRLLVEVEDALTRVGKPSA